VSTAEVVHCPDVLLTLRKRSFGKVSVDAGCVHFRSVGVQRFTVVDNSNFSPNHLTVPLAFLMLASCGVLPSPHIK
jgi:hypothetical protein